MGNITKVVSGTDTLAEYTYDNQNQLVSEDDGQYLTTYTYDTYGNIRSIWVRDSETYSAVLETYEFSYADDRDWKDQLTGVTYTDYNSDGKESGMLTYDAMGNPLTYFNGKKSWNFTWKYGRQLASATDGTHTITNTYDVDGVRESKIVDGVEHKYVTLDGKIIRETYGTVTVNYFYDNEGKPYKLTVDEDNSTSGGYYTGYFVLNQQGDVIAILNANGVKVVSYEYNAWGQIKEETAASTNVGTLFLEHNALKYRGYYYDADFGLYYLVSRFYDPAICRFINADITDVLMANSASLTDKNLYAYCDNNPIMRIDDGGEFWFTVAGAVVGAGLGFASKVMSNILTGSKLFDGVAAATVSGAVYGGIATSPILRTTLGAHVNTIASYTSAAAESLTTEVISYAQGKEVNMSNLKCTAKKILKDTIVEGTQTCIAGKIAGKTVKTNRFWFRPKKVQSSFSGNYAKKVWKQSSVQAFVVIVSNSVRGWINKLCGK